MSINHDAILKSITKLANSMSDKCITYNIKYQIRQNDWTKLCTDH